MKKLIFAGLLSFTAYASVFGQNSASYDQNNVPITGSNNSAFGFSSLINNVSGYNNSAFGSNSMRFNLSGLNNSAFGQSALYRNVGGSENSAFGGGALSNNIGGYQNTAGGYACLLNNTGGIYNTGFGATALRENTTGDHNSGFGREALINNTTGRRNAAVGAHCLYFNDLGTGNAAVGAFALFNNVNGNYNSALGFYADVSAPNLNNATAIGSNAIVNANDRIWLGDVVTDVWTQNSYNTSDGRFKKNINTEEVKGLAFINELRPVVYNFDAQAFTEHVTKNLPDSVKRHYLDRDFSKRTNIIQTGFIAQEVEQAAKKCGYNFSGLHTPDGSTDTYGLSYYQFVVPLVKAVQEQQEMIKALQQRDEEQKQLINELSQKSSNTTGINNLNPIETGFQMSQNEPNPFTHETVVKYTLPTSVANAFMAVYDLTGKQITTFPIEQKGSASITLTSEKLAAGIYIYSIVADGKVVDSKRMIVAEK